MRRITAQRTWAELEWNEKAKEKEKYVALTFLDLLDSGDKE
jgi:hypothetical protein